MSTSSVAVVAVLLALLTAGISAAYYAGVGPGSIDGPLADSPTDSHPGTASSGEPVASDAPFSFTIERVEACGRTCRDVTAALQNTQDGPATDVTVLTRIYAGQDVTDEDLVWAGTEPVGTLEAGGTHTTTRRVELSLQEGLTVEAHGGWITIVTTVRSDERTVTLSDRRRVA